jgi:hypothetical protein
MSLIITVYASNGLVMAADSRLTLDFQLPQAIGAAKPYSVPSSDSTHKVFLAPNRVGISTFGAASIGTSPIGSLLESFIVRELQPASKHAEEVAAALLAHFGSFAGPPACRFHVGGYNGTDQIVYEVNPVANAVSQLNSGGPGAAWGGEADTLSRLHSRVGTLDNAGHLEKELPLFGVAFQHFTLQDAVDFAVYAIRTTADTMRFQLRPKTVGGPIDVLVISPDDARWIKYKQLHITDTP